MTPAPALFIDFDGTVTTRDAIDAILEAFADPTWREVEEAWVAGRIGSRECLREQTALVRASRREIDGLLDAIDVDPGFAPLLDVCATYDVPVSIVSDGFDYCIRRILARTSLNLDARVRDVRIVSSRLQLVDGRWHAEFPAPAEGCSHGCATCKPAIMSRMNVERRRTVFIGDGLSDRYAAEAADLVFAKSRLAAYCASASIPYTPYTSLTSVASHLDGLLASEAATTGAFPRRAFPTT